MCQKQHKLLSVNVLCMTLSGIALNISIPMIFISYFRLVKYVSGFFEIAQWFRRKIPLQHLCKKVTSAKNEPLCSKLCIAPTPNPTQTLDTIHLALLLSLPRLTSISIFVTLSFISCHPWLYHSRMSAFFCFFGPVYKLPMR